MMAAGTGKPHWWHAENKNSAAQKNEEAAQRKAALKAALRNKTEYEKKALSIAEQLLGDDIAEEFFLNCGKYITPFTHYKDIVDEQSIIKLASKYFEDQISKSQVWRRQVKPQDIELLKEGRSEQSGEEVKLRAEVIKEFDIENFWISSEP
ncbi:putative RNA polymerase II subunit B1 CTD phosphatase RPAP2 [Lonchura striata]|uniref:RNA polymerase II subunit B1 CTD phosphatase RPAP2 n=1 Tax=Lonchura striata TaxID=40157 RepID=A0A218UHC9_9PASE|nr:putative RNA polymerase II subunit B1 CTD phosphatase RPAP2 [Lonchura striata domestica]